MDLSASFPVWEELTLEQQDLLTRSTVKRTVQKGTIVHRGSVDCVGLLLICSGQLRVYFTSEDGREVTLYRLFEQDVCLFSASCTMRSIQFDTTVEAEKDTEFWVVPPTVFKQLMEQSLPVSNYVNELLASHFSDAMWLIEQIMWKSFDKRLATFLLEESTLEGSLVLKITHEKIANHMGSAREVVTRMLRYFQSEHLVKLSRGSIEIVDEKRLRAMQ